MYKEFFICPHCERPLASKEKLAEYADREPVYCGYCGKEIEAALAEATSNLVS
jgi:transcription elongation factor Elf1